MNAGVSFAVHSRTGIYLASDSRVTEDVSSDRIDEDLPDATEPSRRQARFQALNPALFTSLAVFIFFMIGSDGYVVFNLLPLGDDGRPTIHEAYREDTYALVFIPLLLMLFSWLIAGFAVQRRWLRILASIVAFAATAFFGGMASVAVFA